MPFIPHTETEARSMLDAIGVDQIATLFEEIPTSLCADAPQQPEQGLSEMEISQLMHSRASADDGVTCFAGGGAYQHHIPAAVWELTTRGEFYSAYTPYQAEASQGTLQLLYEYQSMMSSLMGMDLSNASLYDGASALAEAVLMAVRANRKSKSKRILIPKTVHPNYRKVVHTLVRHQGIELVELEYDAKNGTINPDSLKISDEDPGYAALVIPLPSYFGTLEDVHTLTDWAHSHGMLVIGSVNPIAMASLTPPGEWGKEGADIACGEGQPLGIPLASGGPYFGFLCCRKALVRQLPGRLIGRTRDLDDKEGFTLTLQAREQHIRRSKATSNICTNQGLMVTAATIFMSLMGTTGLEQMASGSYSNSHKLVERLSTIDGVALAFSSPYFHEAVITLSTPVAELLQILATQKIVGGIDLSNDYPELGNALLVCATELRSDDEIEQFATALEQILC
ncbi:MAG: aminomethyl-transferring glycine dehydrogenase subunit GcvPA [Gammaproteobacteria bacterium]|nr:aminomethyl-transferring glycine dehydrogenase subunit GcvPA [Gammaproteobacteria bacterium]